MVHAEIEPALYSFVVRFLLSGTLGLQFYMCLRVEARISM